MCFALALWNGNDPILKERLYGLSSREGNHGEDVKEYYFYLDSTPTHSYMRYLYKYPHAEYPYERLVAMNHLRTRCEFEYELIDTGVFDRDAYFDVFVEYAKYGPEDIRIRISAHNRGRDGAPLHLLPTLWFRNTWSWSTRNGVRPILRRTASGPGVSVVAAFHAEIGHWRLYCAGDVPLLFTENETNREVIFGKPNESPYVKDSLHRAVVRGVAEAVNPAQAGTKCAAHYQLYVPAGESREIQLRLCAAAAPRVLWDRPTLAGAGLGPAQDAVFAVRRRECDEFFDSLTPRSAGDEQARVLRQALSGLFWSKQYYGFDVERWLEERGVDPLGPIGSRVRHQEWFHLAMEEVIAMPDKWEYPWCAGWNLAFHAIALGVSDPDFAKQQLRLLLSERYLHPSGQMPASESEFSDVNPPVHGWAALFVYELERARFGVGDRAFLEDAFCRLLLHFTWWSNRRDRKGLSLFEGGVLGLDGVGVFDRRTLLPGGGQLEEADATAWMALFCQSMLAIAVELAQGDPAYEDMAVRFAEQFFLIGAAVNAPPGAAEGMWDEKDGFYYDTLRVPDGSLVRLRVRSMHGLLPLCATTVMEEAQLRAVPRALDRITARLERNPRLAAHLHASGAAQPGVNGRGILALVGPQRLRLILARMLDESEFLSPYGIRSLSRHHAENPFIVDAIGADHTVAYLPAESDSTMFCGNANWRGPIWFPLNALLIRALRQFYLYYGDSFRVECPTGSGQQMTLFEVSAEIARRLEAIFLPDATGRRPVYGPTDKFQTDPHWRDHVLFYEYFNGDTGAGLGASHQTGWTALIAPIIQIYGELEAEAFLAGGRTTVVDSLVGAGR
jgi:hypothetical protein